jgi:hypothetical protein
LQLANGLFDRALDRVNGYSDSNPDSLWELYASKIPLEIIEAKEITLDPGNEFSVAPPATDHEVEKNSYNENGDHYPIDSAFNDPAADSFFEQDEEVDETDESPDPPESYESSFEEELNGGFESSSEINEVHIRPVDYNALPARFMVTSRIACDQPDGGLEIKSSAWLSVIPREVRFPDKLQTDLGWDYFSLLAESFEVDLQEGLAPFYELLSEADDDTYTLHLGKIAITLSKRDIATTK